MTPLQWPDIEAVIARRLAAQLPGVGVSTTTPNDLRGRAYVRVGAYGGADDGLTDSAYIDVDTFAPTREQAHDLAATVRSAMHALTGTADADGANLVDRATTVVRPRWVDYRNADVQRFVATYSVTTRLQ